MNGKPTMSGRVCFLCDTPYQLLNILNIVFNQSEFDSAILDLLICDRDISESQIQRIESLNLFDNVFRYRTDLETPKQKGILNRTKGFCFPKKNIGSFMKNKMIDCKDYNYLVCAFPIPISVAITTVNPDIKIVLFDDGIGTYLGWIPSPDSKKRRIMYWMKE